MPISSYSGGFYDPNKQYNGQDWNATFPNWEGSAAFLNQAESAPEGAWASRLADIGLGGLNDNSSYARSLLGRVREGWEAAKLRKNPTLRLWDFMDPNNLDVQNIIQGAAPEVRGEVGRHPATTRWQQRLS